MRIKSIACAAQPVRSMRQQSQTTFAWNVPCWITAASVLIVAAALSTTPVRADRGTEWEPGGVLYKFRYRYGQDTEKKARQRKRSEERARKRRGQKARRRPPQRRTAAKEKAFENELFEKSNRRTRRKKRRVRVASLGNSFAYPSRKRSKSPSVTGGSGVTWKASAGCLNSRLRAAIHHVARNFGRVRVNSTCRSRRRNRRVGGARRSKHLSGNAADIRVFGNVRRAARYLRSVAGGYKHYGGGLFHIDTGSKRTW